MPVDQSYELLGYDELKRRFPNASPAFLKRNKAGPAGLRTDERERAQGGALERKTPRKTPGGAGAESCYSITFIVRSRRPMDWDNIRVKDLQDCIVEAGLLPGDGWRVLQGSVISLKADTKKEESTEVIIEIEPL